MGLLLDYVAETPLNIWVVWEKNRASYFIHYPLSAHEFLMNKKSSFHPFSLWCPGKDLVNFVDLGKVQGSPESPGFPMSPQISNFILNPF